MSADIGSLLDELEKVSTEAVNITEAYESGMDFVRLGALLETRRSLIRELSEAVRGRRDLSYSDFNRMVVVHVQGGRIDDRLRAARRLLERQLVACLQGRAYADCIAGLTGEPASALTLQSL